MSAVQLKCLKQASLGTWVGPWKQQSPWPTGLSEGELGWRWENPQDSKNPKFTCCPERRFTPPNRWGLHSPRSQEGCPPWAPHTDRAAVCYCSPGLGAKTGSNLFPLFNRVLASHIAWGIQRQLPRHVPDTKFTGGISRSAGAGSGHTVTNTAARVPAGGSPGSCPAGESIQGPEGVSSLGLMGHTRPFLPPSIHSVNTEFTHVPNTTLFWALRWEETRSLFHRLSCLVGRERH